MSDATSGTTTPFPTLPAKPDHPALEQHILGVWDEQRAFERLRARNAGGPKFSFIDGPITANNPMGVHHAWGRTLKDVYQRFWAMRGYDQRYQNGFDCQGLWVEVEVEKSLQLNSKREIEEYGLDRFSRACRDRVAEFSEVQTRQSQRLGQWMDWDNDYYTLSDTNISYIWTFLAKCHERGWLYVGHRPMTWCPRCGTSLSQHEMLDSYKDVVHPSLHVAFPLLERAGEAVVVWTTTPWTLPANVAAAVNPDATYALVQREGELDVWMAQQRVAAVFGEDATVLDTRPGSELVGWRYRGPFAHLPGSAGGEAPCTPGGREHRQAAIAAREQVWRVLAWDEVSLDDGTGIVHIAPGCGAEDYELGTKEGLPAIVPVDEAGVFFDGFGELSGLTTHDAKDVVLGDLRQQGLLVRAGTLEHRYPSCWRCGTELIFRLVDEWFISAADVREPMKEANRQVEWSPAFYGKRMEDWLNNMGDWCISRKRYWGLPLPFYRDPEEGDDGEIFVVHSKAQLRELATDPAAVDALPELHRPWIDDITIRHPETGRVLERVTEVGDCWLDAGIVPFATLGWRSEEIGQGLGGMYANGASEGLSTAVLPGHEEWEQWFPADVVLEMREQIRLWFYSMLFMSVVLDGRAPYRRVVAYEKVNAEDGRAMHKSWGNAIWFDDAVEQMGADVMRWMYVHQTPSQNLNFGYGPAGEIKKRFLTLWNVLSFFTQYANADGWRPDADLVASTGEAALVGLQDHLENPLDMWLAARSHLLVSETTAALERWDTPQYTRAIERWFDDLSNWYVRRSRRRFWKAELGEGDRDHAYAVLWKVLTSTARVLAPVTPFMAEHMWQQLVVPHAGTSTPDSVHLVPWPEHDEALVTHPLLDQVDAVQRVLALGRAARASSRLKLRQPLREVLVHRRSTRGEGTEPLEALFGDWSADVLAELSVKQLRFVDEPAGIWSEGLMPLLPRLGPKYGKQVADIRRAIAAGDVEILEGGRARVGEFTLEPDEYEHRSSATDGYALAEDAEWVVAVTTALDDELVAEGRAREITRVLQAARKDAGLDISDRIAVTWSAEGALADAIRTHAIGIGEEVLATSFDEGDAAAGTSFTVDGLEGRVQLARA